MCAAWSLCGQPQQLRSLCHGLLKCMHQGIHANFASNSAASRLLWATCRRHAYKLVRHLLVAGQCSTIAECLMSHQQHQHWRAHRLLRGLQTSKACCRGAKRPRKWAAWISVPMVRAARRLLGLQPLTARHSSAQRLPHSAVPNEALPRIHYWEIGWSRCRRMQDLLQAAWANRRRGCCQEQGQLTLQLLLRRRLLVSCCWQHVRTVGLLLRVLTA